MAGTTTIEILCTACGADTLVRREPKFDGLRKVGERFLCASCGHEFPDEASVPWKVKRKTTVFGEADRVRHVRVFDDGEKQRNCRYCRHYTVNPFTQWCGLHKKDVKATDFCDRFEKKPDDDPPAAAKPQGKAADARRKLEDLL